jgi:hypothetical protein
VARNASLISPNTTRRIGVAPVPILVALIAILDLTLPTSVAASVAFNPLVIFAALQTLFLFGTSAVVAYICLKSYLSGGSRTILLLGSGTLAWGFASMVASWLLAPPGGPNIAVTISNSGALLASLFYIASATTTISATSRDSKRRKSKLILAYGSAVGFLSVLTVLALLGSTPSFFVPEIGSTVLRQVIVATGLFLFAVSSILFMRLYHDSRSPILFWYSMALALTAIGLAAFYFGRTVGDPIAWTGRIATYLGGIYSLIAIWSAARSSHGGLSGPYTASV